MKIPGLDLVVGLRRCFPLWKLGTWHLDVASSRQADLVRRIGHRNLSEAGGGKLSARTNGRRKRAEHKELTKVSIGMELFCAVDTGVASTVSASASASGSWKPSSKSPKSSSAPACAPSSKSSKSSPKSFRSSSSSLLLCWIPTSCSRKLDFRLECFIDLSSVGDPGSGQWSS